MSPPTVSRLLHRFRQLPCFIAAAAAMIMADTATAEDAPPPAAAASAPASGASAPSPGLGEARKMPSQPIDYALPANVYAADSQ